MKRIYKLRYVLCGLSGILTALSFSSSIYMWLIFISLIPLFMVFLNPDFKLKKRQTLLAMMCFSLLYYGFSLRWIYNLQISNSNTKTRILIGIGIIGLSLLMGLYWGFVLMFYPAIRKGKLIDVVNFALLFVLGEWLQEICYPIAFPWVRIGVILTPFKSFIQSASLFGSLFISFLIVTVNGLLLFSFYHRKQPRIFTKAFICLAIIFSVNLTYGSIRIQNLNNTDKTEKTFSASLIQTNLLGEEKWQLNHSDLLEGYLKLTKETITKNTDIVIFPETSLPFYLFEDKDKSQLLLDFAYKNDVTLIVGTSYREADLKYNSIVAISPDGTFSDVYSKQVLVPFGEYLPFKGEFMQNLLSSLFDSSTEYTAGVLSNPINTSIGKVGGIICYESIFPEIARKNVLQGAEVLTVISNDSWFGNTGAINQHYYHSVMRAVENGRYLLRCSSTAVTAIISPSGKEIITAPHFKSAGISGEFKLLEKKTLYTYIGDVIVLPASVIFIIGFLKERKNKKSFNR